MTIRTTTTRRSPFADVPAEARPALRVLGALGVARAIALILIAWGVSAGIVTIIDGTDQLKQAILCGGVGVLLRAVVEWAALVVARGTAVTVRRDVRSRLLGRMLAGGGSDLPGTAGSRIALATEGLDDLDEWATGYLPALMSAMTVPWAVGIALLLADWVSALIVLVTIPLVPVFMVLIGQYTAERTSSAMTAVGRLSHHVLELARGLPVLVGLGRAGEQVRALREIADAVRTRTMETLRTAFLSSLALELIATISVALVAVAIGLRLVNGSMPLESGLFALLLAPECYQPFRDVGAAFHRAEDGVTALRRARTLIETPVAAGLVAGSGDGIRVHDLTIRYPEREDPVVDGMTFSLHPGEIVALTGASGSGKSSLLAALAGVSGGDAELNGRVYGLDPDRIAWVPQHPQWSSETVHDELALVVDDEAAIRRVLARLGVEALAGRHPAELSPGELRRVAVARGLLRVEAGADVLLLDEPTAHLDHEHAELVRVAITGLRHDVTVCVASHDPETMAIANRCVAIGASTAVSAPVRDSRQTDVRNEKVPENNSADVTTRPYSSNQRVWHDLLARHRTAFVLALAAGVAASVAGVALTSVSGWLIVRASEQPPILYLLVAIVGVRFCGIGRAVFRYAERLKLHDAIFAAMTDLRVRVWEGMSQEGLASRSLLRAGASLDRLIADVDRLRDLAPRVLIPPIIGVTTGLIAIVAMGIVLPGAGAVMLVGTIVALGGGTLAMWARSAVSARDALSQTSLMVQHVTGLALAASDIHGNALDHRVLERVRNVDNALAEIDAERARSEGAAAALVSLACGATALAMLCVGTAAVSEGRLSTTLLAVIVLTPLALIDVYVDAIDAVRQWDPLRQTADRLSPIMRVEPDLHDSTDREPIDEIRLERVSARWPGAERPVFDEISLAARRGDWIVVTGPSGVGKSTLLAVVLGFLRPESGIYWQNGVDTASLAGDVVRRRIAWLPQEAHIFESTVRGNLLVARSRRERSTDAEVQRVLAQVGLDDELERMPDGLDTRLGASGARVSGGQRTRLAVARALLTDADVVLLDEPTAHLDREAARALVADLQDALGGHIVIVVSHQAEEQVGATAVLRLGSAVQSR